jgi:hypothetical protein
VVLAGALVIMALLMGVGSVALFSGSANLSMSTNLKLATRARATAEAAVNEALYRLSRQETQPEAIVPDLTDPNWQVQIMPNGASNPPTQVATIQNPSDWPHYANTPPVTLQYKRDTDGNVVFYDRTLSPPFLVIALPGNIPTTAFPVIQILATGLDSREAQRQTLVEAARSTLFAPAAPLSSGVDVNLNGSGFIDGVNHDHRIYLTGGSGSAAIYGDSGNETTDVHSGNQIKDSPDDNADDTDPKHGIANPSLPAPASSVYPRLFNMQVSSTDPTPAWVGLTEMGSDQWTGVNQGYASAIALSNGPTVVNDQPPTGNVYTRGVFSWRTDNQGGIGTIPGYPSECSPSGTPTLVCKPAGLTPFPTLQQYLGLDNISFKNLLANADTAKADLDAGSPPLGFTYVQGNYTFNNSTASPGSNDFGLLYVTGNLTITGDQTFKGLIFVDGSLQVTGNPTVLGAIMVRGTTSITAGTGNLTLLYSRKAADLGIQAARPWRVLSWKDTAMQ